LKYIGRVSWVAKLEGFGVRGQADDFVWLVAAKPSSGGGPVDRHVLPKGIRAGEVAAHHRLIDDRYRRTARIAKTEIPSCDQQYAERFEVSRADKRQCDALSILRPFRVPFHNHVTPAGPATLKQRTTANRCRPHPRNRLHPRQKLPVSGGQLLGRVTAAVYIERDQKDMIAAKSQVEIA